MNSLPQENNMASQHDSNIQQSSVVSDFNKFMNNELVACNMKIVLFLKKDPGMSNLFVVDPIGNRMNWRFVFLHGAVNIFRYRQVNIKSYYGSHCCSLYDFIREAVEELILVNGPYRVELNSALASVKAWCEKNELAELRTADDNLAYWA